MLIIYATQGCHVTINVSLLKENYFTTKILGWTHHKSYENLHKLDLLCNYKLRKKINIFILFFALLSKYLKCYCINTFYCGLLSPKCKDLQLLKKQNLHLFGYFQKIILSIPTFVSK